MRLSFLCVSFFACVSVDLFVLVATCGCFHETWFAEQTKEEMYISLGLRIAGEQNLHLKFQRIDVLLLAHENDQKKQQNRTINVN